MNDYKKITVAFGDGIGPEIMYSTLEILRKAQARIQVETIDIGEEMYRRNYTSGISEESWESIGSNKIFLKAPITTPQGKGYKSLNVTLRKTLGLFANIRPVCSYNPFIPSIARNDIDLVIVRENEEDLYAGIEYRHTNDMYKSLKLITESGSEKIIRYAFEYAVRHSRKKVTCFTKDNIMKFSDGIFHKVFERVAKNYPNIASDHYIVDIGTAKLAAEPHKFDVIVTSNLYGDIISDVASEISGSIGLAGSSNIGQEYAMFEAVHGSAPDIAQKNIANPSGLINAAIMMLNHIGQGDVASNVENALRKTIEDGIHTADIYNPKISNSKVSTKEFTLEVIKNLGFKPSTLPHSMYTISTETNKVLDNDTHNNIDQSIKKIVGIDLFIDLKLKNCSSLANDILQVLNTDTQENQKLSEFIMLHTISTKGLRVWQDNKYTNISSDHWCCRFMINKKYLDENSKIDANRKKREIVLEVIRHLYQKFDVVSTEMLFDFNDQRGYSLSQGE